MVFYLATTNRVKKIHVKPHKQTLQNVWHKDDKIWFMLARAVGVY